jgi:glycosyltransferase involved in cell wall biosynthesis
MKIAFVSFGFAEYCVRLATAMPSSATILLLLPRKQAEPYAHRLDPSVDLQLFDAPRLRQLWRQLKTVTELTKKIRTFAPDIIHLQAAHLWFVLALPFLRRWPLVLTVHDCQLHPGDRASSRTPQVVARFTCRRANQIIVHSDHVRQQMMCQFPSLRDRIHLVPLIQIGQEVDGQDPVADRQPKVLFFGRIWKYKGLEYLIRAEPSITSRVPGARIVIAGQGEDLAPYRKMMVHPEHFEVHNEYISDNCRTELFTKASLVVLPYIEASQSGVIPLAYTHGKPVIVTKVGGLPEMVEDERTGLCVNPRDEQALANAIVRLLTDEQLCRQMGENARHKVNTEYSPAAVAKDTLHVYSRALGGLAEGPYAPALTI